MQGWQAATSEVFGTKGDIHEVLVPRVEDPQPQDRAKQGVCACLPFRPASPPHRMYERLIALQMEAAEEKDHQASPTYQRL